MKLLLGLLLSWAASRVQAQVYAAPGMPVQVQRARAPVAAKPPTKDEAAIVSPVFPRFWHLPPTMRDDSAARFKQFQSSQMHYPATSMRAATEGKITALVTILPNGMVAAVRITRREMDEWEKPLTARSPGATALEAEVIRVISQLRFRPFGLATDTVSMTQQFTIQ